MATPGTKPKPSSLRLLIGTSRPDRHGSVSEQQKSATQAQAAFGKPQRPSRFKAQAAQAWKRYIEPAFWLDGSREPAAIAFCELWQEFRFNPVGFPAAKHGQMRAYMTDLGLTDERNRLGNQQDEEDEFFD